MHIKKQTKKEEMKFVKKRKAKEEIKERIFKSNRKQHLIWKIPSLQIVKDAKISKFFVRKV